MERKVFENDFSKKISGAEICWLKWKKMKVVKNPNQMIFKWWNKIIWLKIQNIKVVPKYLFVLLKNKFGDKNLLKDNLEGWGRSLQF